MTFRTLEDISVPILTRTFNLAFSDYSVPMHLTDDLLLDKMKNDRIDLKISAGAFENNKLVGFVLHGADLVNNKLIAYNGGTGVIPSSRGNNLTGKIYDFINPVLKQRGFKECILEVIASNKPAIKNYRKIGFQTNRVLHCFKGTLDIKNSNFSRTIEILDLSEISEIEQYWNFTPSWQNSFGALQKSGSDLMIFGIKESDHLLAYLIVNQKTSKVPQFGVARESRRQSFGTQLFYHLQHIGYKDLNILNIDSRDITTNSFLASIGLKKYIEQLEMKMIL